MSKPSPRPLLYKGYRFPPEIIRHGVWLYYRFGVSLRDVSELMLAQAEPERP
jgi:putative transposase